MMIPFNYKGRRDDFLSRLVLFIEHRSRLGIYGVQPIKSHVCILYTEKGIKIIKGHENAAHLHTVYHVLNRLKECGFRQAVNYEHYPQGELALPFGNKYWTLTPYVPSVSVFSYRTFEQREQVLMLLRMFHQCGETALPTIKSPLPKLCLPTKWKERLRDFQKNHSRISLYLSKNLFTILTMWAEKSLSWSKQFFKAPATAFSILHGDVASHNVIPSRDGRLWLIDFDLLCTGPKEYEYIQLMQRFLSYTQWSFSSLFQHPLIKEGATAKWVISLLLFPADLLREWNQLCINPVSSTSRQQLNHLVQKTKMEIYFRQRLVSEATNYLFNENKK
ncbi:phosphotransferase [Bacillus songklensis]